MAPLPNRKVGALCAPATSSSNSTRASATPDRRGCRVAQRSRAVAGCGATASSAGRLHCLRDLERPLRGAALGDRLVAAIRDRVESKCDLFGGIVAVADMDALRQRHVCALERA